MGSGTWSANVYTTAASYRATTGRSAFGYNDDDGATEVHPTMDPTHLGATGVRESRDSAEHLRTMPVIVGLDETGSMDRVPRALLERLPQLYGLLLRKGYVEHPQIMYMGIGDATCDRAPLQVGQFESDNRADEWLGKLYLEGNGGGQKTESYELALWFAANKVTTDAWEKRGARGYMFIVGDEMPYPQVKRTEVARIIGATIEADVPTEEAVAAATRMWDVYYIMLTAGTYHAGDAEVLARWRGLLGQNVILLPDPDAVCEAIALAIGLGEGAVDLEEGLDDLKEVGSGAGEVVGTALAELGSSRGSVVTKPAPTDLDGTSGNERF